MNTVGVKDFSMIDLIKPESKRLRRHISAVINFAKFREERLVHGVELTQEVDALAAKKQQAEDENERLVNELRAATAVREQEAPEESRLKGENEGLATTVQEAFNQQTAVHEDSLRLKQELEQVKDRLAETKYQVLNAKEELELLRAQIVPDPKKLKQELQALQEAVAHEKENVRQVEASGCEASRQLEASERAEREVEAVLHGQARTPQPPQHPPTMHSPWP
jgi:kinetochore protein Nuf2